MKHRSDDFERRSMAFTITGTGNWNNAYTGLNTGAGGACNLVNATNYSGGIGTIAQNAEWRVDRQAPPPGKINLQIQKNGVGNPSSIACCILPANINCGNIHAPGAAGVLANARASELTKAVHGALTRSVGSRRDDPAAQANQVLKQIQAFEITGNFSA
jgi:hypothetical protein